MSSASCLLFGENGEFNGFSSHASMAPSAESTACKADRHWPASERCPKGSKPVGQVKARKSTYILSSFITWNTAGCFTIWFELANVSMLIVAVCVPWPKANTELEEQAGTAPVASGGIVEIKTGTEKKTRILFELTINNQRFTLCYRHKETHRHNFWYLLPLCWEERVWRQYQRIWICTWSSWPQLPSKHHHEL